MNIQTIKLVATAYSMKREIKYLFFIVLATCMIPVFAVLILTQAGIDIVSNALATYDPQLLQVDIHDPRTGEITGHVATSITWPATGSVSLEFARPSPYQIFHTGIDIASPNSEVGDPVISFMEGKVIYADTIDWGFGKHVKIDHGTHITSVYAHLDTLSVVEGQEVEVGTVLGTRGNTGWSTGPHLHFQINIYGIPVNPRVFLKDDPNNV